MAYFTGFTLFYVPFMAMPAEMTDDYDERTSIMSFRVAYSSAGGIVLAAGMPAMIAQLGSDRQAYELTSIVAAVLITLSMLMTVAFTGGARELPSVDRERHTLREYLSSLFRNRPFFTLAAIKFFVFLSAGINGAAGMFFMAHIIQRGEMGMAFLTFGSQVASLLTIPLWTRLSVGRDKRWFWMFAMLVNVGVNASWAFASPTESDLIFGARAIIGGAMSSLGLLMGFSMLPDTIEYDRLTTRHDRAGMFTGLLGFIEKNAFAFGPLLIGFFFSAAGVAQGDSQSAEAITAIVAAKAWIPAAILFLSAALLFTYKLDSERLEELRAEAESSGGAPAPEADASAVGDPVPEGLKS